jgi:hypothetical protein
MLSISYLQGAILFAKITIITPKPDGLWSRHQMLELYCGGGTFRPSLCIPYLFDATGLRATLLGVTITINNTGLSRASVTLKVFTLPLTEDSRQL